MVLEYVRGYHLGQWARYLRLKGRSVPASIALQVIIDVLDALDHAHSMVHPDGTSMHIVHRDISPSNILLDEDGRARLLDFGVARMRGGEHEYQTQVKGFVGKLMYSAPEIFADGDATPSSDCYSCAVVLHEALLGRNTFRAENQAKTLHRVLSHAPEPLTPAPGIPDGLDAVLFRALAKAPEERYGSARELAAALRALQPQPENDVRASLAGLLKNDFGREMAELLGIESLADRDEAWRRTGQRATSSAPPPQLDAQDSTYRLDPTQTSTSGSFGDTTTGGGPATQGPTSVEGRRALASMRPASDLPSLRPPPPPPAALRSLPPAPSVPNPTTPGLGTKPARGSSAVAWAMVAILGTGLAGLVTYQRLHPAPAVVPNIKVVQQPTRPGVDAAPGAASPKPTVTPVAPSKNGDEASSKPAQVVEPARHASTEQRLTRAVRKQQEQFNACMKQAALKTLPPIFLEFELDADGKQTALSVKPPSIGNTEFGRCLHAAASAARFPSPGKAVSLSIPLATNTGR
jgi:serine/threonine protein kinase